MLEVVERVADPKDGSLGGHTTWSSSYSLLPEYARQIRLIRFHIRNLLLMGIVASTLDWSWGFPRSLTMEGSCLLEATGSLSEEDKGMMHVVPVLHLKWAYGEGQHRLHLDSHSARLVRYLKHRGMVGGTRQSFLLRAEEDVAAMRRQVLLVCLCSDLSLRLRGAVYQRYVPPGRSCTLSSVECSSSSGLVDHLVLEDIESFSVGNGRTRPMFDDTLACYAPCYLLAITRQMIPLLDCACVA